MISDKMKKNLSRLKPGKLPITENEPGIEAVGSGVNFHMQWFENDNAYFLTYNP